MIGSTRSRGIAAGAARLEHLPRDPALYPQKLDPLRRAVLLVLMDEAAYRRHSFLDDRMLEAETRASWLPLEAFLGAAEIGPEPSRASPDFIFHVGHCGSTLLSRLLAELDRVLPLREPLPLRWLADEALKRGRPHWLLGEPAFERLLATFQALWARTFRPGQRVLLKATSGCNDLAGELLASPSGPRAIALYVRCEDYVATMLRNEATLADLRGFAEARLERLHRTVGRQPWTLADLSPGEIAAMGWVTEILALARAPGEVLWLDFEDLLTATDEVLARVGDHLRLDLAGSEIALLTGSDVLGRYAKAPTYPFDPAVRREQLRASARRNDDELRRARRWLDAALRRIDGLDGTPPLRA